VQARHGPGFTAADVLKYPLMHLDDHAGWLRWLTAANVKLAQPLQGLVMNRASMVIDAAVNGDGFGLSRTALASWDLINKRLIAPVGVALPLSSAYWIVAPQATANLPKIVTFRNWLLAEAAEDTKADQRCYARDLTTYVLAQFMGPSSQYRADMPH
jgi:LysR family transcriptional regulator, glycine cleavage system transcriptional activator